MSNLKTVLFILFSFVLFVPKTLAMERPTSNNSEESKKTTPAKMKKQKVWPFLSSGNDSVSPEETCIEAVFLGPSAENHKLLEELIVDVLRAQVFWRRDLHPEDPIHITESVKRTPEYLKTLEVLQQEIRLLLANLKNSIPVSSLRHQAHMYGDTTLPSLIAYFAAMLSTPNNVAFEGSPATSFMEEKAAEDLCKLIGYSISDSNSDSNNSIKSWGQLTAGGTTANIQALWVARNLKFWPLAIKWALADEKFSKKYPNLSFEDAKNVTVNTLDDKELLLRTTDDWTLLNIESDETLSIAKRAFGLIKTKGKEGKQEISSSRVDQQELSFSDFHQYLTEFSLQRKGWRWIYSRLDKLIQDPVVFITGTRHYSWPKAMSLLGIGDDNLVNIHVDADGRMDTQRLWKKIIKANEKKRPIIAVVAIAGSTEEGAVDPINEIVNLRKTSRTDLKADFYLHIDAAYGGYHTTLIRSSDDRHELAPPPSVPALELKKDVQENYECLHKADSVTIDPHKSFMPYPAGAICLRNQEMRFLTNFTAPVLGVEKDQDPSVKEERKPSIGTFGVEGSRPGASAAAVYVSHRVIPLTKEGHGKILGKALFGTKEFYWRLLAMDEKDFTVVPLARLPDEEKPEDYFNNKPAWVKKIKEKYEDKDKEKYKDKEGYLNTLQEFGPDLNVLVYAFNFNTKEGQPNQDINKANLFNQLIYKKLTPRPHKNPREYKLIVSNTSLESSYGDTFLKYYEQKLLHLDKESEDAPKSIQVLRSVVMNPWVTSTENGSFLITIIKDLTDVVRSVLKKRATNGLD